MSRLVYLSAVILAVMFSCKSQKKQIMDEESDVQSSSAITMLMTDNYGGTENEELQVIRSKGELDKFFIKVNRTRKPGIKPPSIDFTKNMALIYCPGKSTQQPSMKLQSSQKDEMRITISQMKTEVSDNQESTAVIMPFGLYIMPLTDKEIVLQTDSRP